MRKRRGTEDCDSDGRLICLLLFIRRVSDVVIGVNSVAVDWGSVFAGDIDTNVGLVANLLESRAFRKSESINAILRS
jgi:hypothetical protein